MGSGQLGGVLHVILQVPESGQAHVGDVHNIIALTDRGALILPIRHGGADGQSEASQAFIQRKQVQQSARCFGNNGHSAFGSVLLVGILGHVFVVETTNLIDKEGNAALVSSSGPLRIETSRELVFVDIDGLVEVVDVVRLAPFLGVLELIEGIVGNELAGAKVTQQCFVVMSGSSPVGAVARRVVSFVLANLLELGEALGLALAQLSDMSFRPLEDGGLR
jgi:hypothetical protein